MSAPYLDTSALAKWFLSEAGSAEFEQYILKQSSAVVSSLTGLELRSVLGRRRREGHFSPDLEQQIFAAYQNEILRGFLKVCPLAHHHTQDALEIMEQLPEVGLRSLDALHLAIARDHGSTTIATADALLSNAAQQLGMEIEIFGVDPSLLK